MLQLNPRLLNPDEAFLNDTGEIVHISHAVAVDKGIFYCCSYASSGKQTNRDEHEITFLTNKYDWHAYVASVENDHGFLRYKNRMKYGE